MKLYNSLSGQKETLVPIRPGHVSLYACGMTVYDYCHIGHARSLIFFDMLVRYLRSRGYQVNYVRNITDIDDKIIHRARGNQETCEALATRFIEIMRQDEQALHLLSPDHEPRATHYIPQMLELIAQLFKQGYAYVADGGDVCFDLHRWPHYGKLSHHHVDQLRSAVSDQGAGKRDPLDFVLWKSAKPGEPQWDSPWGAGRPGWHIECSAMSTGLLGQPFDIHGGGMDLKFPHHENEIAQSEAAHGCQFANLWMHVGLLNVGGEKMSKSLGNFITIRDALKQHDAELIRYFMMSGHYRQPIDYSDAQLTQLKAGLDRLYLALRGLPTSSHQPPSSSSSAIFERPQRIEQQFHEAMEDDLNTPLAVSQLFELAHHIQRCLERQHMGEAVACGNTLVRLGQPFGILYKNPDTHFQGSYLPAELERIEALVAERNRARAAKDWKQADQIRHTLLEEMNVIVDDTSQGTTWRRQTSAASLSSNES